MHVYVRLSIAKYYSTTTVEVSRQVFEIKTCNDDGLPYKKCLVCVYRKQTVSIPLLCIVHWIPRSCWIEHTDSIASDYKCSGYNKIDSIANYDVLVVFYREHTNDCRSSKASVDWYVVYITFCPKLNVHSYGNVMIM